MATQLPAASGDAPSEPQTWTALVLEMVALRHQIAVLKRSGTRRPRFRFSDRLFWLLLARWWSDWRDSLIVQPGTVLRWRRGGWLGLWRYRSRGRWRGGRPIISSTRSSPCVTSASQRVIPASCQTRRSTFACPTVSPLRRRSGIQRGNRGSMFNRQFGASACKPRSACPLWCEHPRRGRVKFEADYLKPVHALAIVETQSPVPLLTCLPKVCNGVPISYFSLSDFLNLIKELRAFPEIIQYLGERALFSESAQIPLSAERAVYVRYLANEGGFGDCRSYEEILQSLTELSIDDLFHEKHLSDRPAEIVERFVDSLSERIALHIEKTDSRPSRSVGSIRLRRAAIISGYRKNSATCVYAIDARWAASLHSSA
jgi:hypothetical protein